MLLLLRESNTPAAVLGRTPRSGGGILVVFPSSPPPFSRTSFSFQAAARSRLLPWVSPQEVKSVVNQASLPDIVVVVSCVVTNGFPSDLVVCDL